MNIMSIFQDENGQYSMTRMVLLLVVLCVVTEWQKAIWGGDSTWSPDAWRMSILGGTGVMKLIQKKLEKK
tara:strand:- start:36 stop:245 length:210 start_codon:yes stop_codon:yes gene_type:complete